MSNESTTTSEPSIERTSVAETIAFVVRAVFGFAVAGASWTLWRSWLGVGVGIAIIVLPVLFALWSNPIGGGQ